VSFTGKAGTMNVSDSYLEFEWLAVPRWLDIPGIHISAGLLQRSSRTDLGAAWSRETAASGNNYR
jgi:hypothetical protein